MCLGSRDLDSNPWGPCVVCRVSDLSGSWRGVGWGGATRVSFGSQGTEEADPWHPYTLNFKPPNTGASRLRIIWHPLKGPCSVSAKRFHKDTYLGPCLPRKPDNGGHTAGFPADIVRDIIENLTPKP